MEPNGVTQTNPEDNQEVLEPTGDGQEQVVEEKLYAGRFKTPEELEEHYKLSSTEGQRLAAEVKRLQSLVKGASAQPMQPHNKQGGYDGFFDNDTDKALEWKIQNLLTSYAQSQKSEESYRKQVAESWEDTKKEYPDLANQQSELFQLADKILFERGLATKDEATGVLTLATPFAYRIAVDAAYAQLSKQAPAKQALAAKKGQATAISGRSTSGYVPTGRLTDDQYGKLSEDEKDAYDKWTTTQPRR